MTPEVSTLLVAIGVIAVLVAGGTYWWVNRTPNVASGTDDALPLFGGVEPGAERPPAAQPRPAVGAGREAGVAARRSPPRPSPGAPEPRAAAPERTSPMPDGSVARPPQVPPVARTGPVIREFTTGGPTAPVTQPASSPPAAVTGAVPNAEAIPGVMVEGHALRYSVPAEGTLQFLPGRLEITAGLDKGREIRLVQLEGPDGIEVTFGRADGPLYRHVQLREATVSRLHARMRFSAGEWTLESLSRTNPVVLDGQPMAEHDRRTLADGAVIEMGEVVFTFRGR